MEPIPDDPAAARQARLERWADEQANQLRERRKEERRRLEAHERRLDTRARRLRRLWKDMLWTIRVRLGTDADRILDRRLHTAPVDFDVPETTNVDGRGYVASPWYILPLALRAVGACDRDVFVDFGCGRGRIVHQAARRPMRRVIGVEASPELADFARALVAAHRHAYRCPVEIVTCDAARFPIPDDVTIVYLFNPFGEDTLDSVLGNLVESIDRRPRRVRLIYVFPSHGARVLATGRFRLATWQRGGLRDVKERRAAIFESVG